MGLCYAGCMASSKRDRYYVFFETWLGGIVVGLTILLVPIILIPEFVVLSDEWRRTFWAIDWFIWYMFVLELVVLLALSRDRRQYLKEHSLDVFIVVFSVPLLFEALRFERLLRLVRLFALVFRKFGHIGMRYVRDNSSYLMGVTLVSVLMLGIAVAHMEEALPGANITSADVGVWWAISTVTTVGYGDYYPVSLGGRVVGVTLMLAGVSIYLLLVAQLSVWFSKENDRKFRKDVDRRLAKIERLLEEMAEKR